MKISKKQIEQYILDGAPLYCFILNGNGRIFRREIPTWTFKASSYYNGRGMICFDNKKYAINKSYGNYAFDSSKIDRFLADKMFTFDPDEKHAEELIIADLSERKKKAEKEYYKYKRVLQNIEYNIRKRSDHKTGIIFC